MVDLPLFLDKLVPLPKDSVGLAVLGCPIKHSISPQLHQSALRDMAETDAKFSNWRYDKIEVPVERLQSALVSLAKERILRGPIHSYVGQEAVAAGVLANVSAEDAVTSTHRGHGHYLAKGGNLLALLDELCGLETGCNGGLGGSMHVADLTKGLYGANGIVGGGVPIACGLALSSKLDNSSRVIVSFFGDGACLWEDMMMKVFFGS